MIEVPTAARSSCAQCAVWMARALVGEYVSSWGEGGGGDVGTHIIQISEPCDWTKSTVSREYCL